MSNAPKASGLSGTSAPPAIAASTSCLPGRVPCLADGDGPGGARVGGREDRPADVEGDPEVGRRRPTEHREGQVRRDRLDAPLEIRLVLGLGVCDPAERAAEVDPDPLPGGGPASPGRSPASSRASWPATRPNWLNRSSWRAVRGGIHAIGSKSSTWAATWLRNGDGSKRSIRLTGERPARSPARNASTPVPIAVITPMPVIQTRRRSLMSSGSSDRDLRTSRRPKRALPRAHRTWRASGRRSAA